MVAGLVLRSVGGGGRRARGLPLDFRNASRRRVAVALSLAGPVKRTRIHARLSNLRRIAKRQNHRIQLIEGLHVTLMSREEFS